MKSLLFLLLSAFAITEIYPQVGIGTVVPDSNSALDVTATDKGLLIPRVALSATTATTPLSAHIAGMTIYNTATVSDVTPGFYYNNGARWIRASDAANPLNIYTSNGTLSGTRVVSQGTNSLTFSNALTSGTAVSFNSTAASTGTGFTVTSANNTGTLFNVANTAASGSGITARIQSNATAESGLTVLNNGHVGIGISAPTKVLDINANNDALKVTNLPNLPASTASNALVIDASGNIYKNNVESVSGQIIRVGLNTQTLSTTFEVPIRFNTSISPGMGNAPNGAPNFINTIVGSSIITASAVTAGIGTPSRTTDRIQLPVGVYKITARLVVNYSGLGNGGTFFLKCTVNNNEYSLINFSHNGNNTTNLNFEDYINITGSAQFVDFTGAADFNAMTISSSASPGTGNSYRSLILIERLR